MNQVSASTHYNYVKVVRDISEKKYSLTPPACITMRPVLVSSNEHQGMRTIKKKKTMNIPRNSKPK
jgi:hypothetical protein